MTALFGTKTQKSTESKAVASPRLSADPSKGVRDERLLSVLVRPLVTEKGTRQNALNQYAFVVASAATKSDVRHAVHAVYGVTPVHVNMARVRGKSVRYGRTAGTTKAWKKAIVTLKAGDKIQVYEGV